MASSPSAAAAAGSPGFVFNSGHDLKGYQRSVNKNRKNLRCFPHCRLKGHVKSGFCGAPLAFQLDSLPAAANGNVERVLTWGEFISFTSPPRFSPGDIVSEHILEQEERSVEKPVNALFRGDLDECSKFNGSFTSHPPRFQFNLQMVSYHCAWMPQTPPVKDDRPCFIAHVFVQGVDINGQLTLECLFSCRSCSFEILGRAPEAKPNKPILKAKTQKLVKVTPECAATKAKLEEIYTSDATIGRKICAKRNSLVLPKTADLVSKKTRIVVQQLGVNSGELVPASLIRMHGSATNVHPARVSVPTVRFNDRAGCAFFGLKTGMSFVDNWGA